MDHAGIATQVWNWKNKYGGTILQQLCRLGALWIGPVRDHRLVNWDCVLQTAISDIEVDYTDIKKRTLLMIPGYENAVEFGVLTSFSYPLEEDLGEIIVATTRVETMLGDTAIAVHPDDVTYQHLHGKHAIHPFNGRRICIICDAILVDPEFETGAVKITPAHDHNLEFINIFTNDGKMNEHCGEFAGMPRFIARNAVAEALKKKGLWKDAKTNEMRIGICSSCGAHDEAPMVYKVQWHGKGSPGCCYT